MNGWRINSNKNNAFSYLRLFFINTGSKIFITVFLVVLLIILTEIGFRIFYHYGWVDLFIKNKILQEEVGVTFPFSLFSISKKDSLIHNHLAAGDEFQKNDQFEEALIEYQKALKLHKNADVYYRLGKLFLAKAEIAYRNKEDYKNAYQGYAEGVFYVQQGLKRWPDDVELNFILGLLHFMRNEETDAAIESFQKVLKLNPKHKSSYYRLMEVYLRRFEYDKAKLCLQNAITIFPEEARFYTDLGIVYMNIDSLTKAQDYLNYAIELDNDLKAKYYLHQVRSRMRKKEAIELRR